MNREYLKDDFYNRGLVVYNPTKTGTARYKKAVQQLKYLQSKRGLSLETIPTEPAASKTQDKILSCMEPTDLLIVLGGDGTIWSNSQSTHFILHKLGANEAEVTEGSKVFGGAWERLHYDWSKPGIVKLRTIDSNIWTNGSGWEYNLEQADDGSGSLIIARVTRYPRSKKGSLILMFVGSIGRPLIKRSFRQTLRAI